MSADPVSSLADAVAGAVGAAVELERPSDPEHGDFATNAALQLAGARRQAPRDLAAELAAQVAALPDVERAEVAGPGFVNLFLTDRWFAAALAEMLEVGDRFGGNSAQLRERIQIEMVSANPTGPITVASARNGAYGDSVARLLEFAGHDVAREYYYNDSGAQMDRFRASVEAVRRGEPVPEDGYQGAYIAELAAVPGDPVPGMLHRIEETLERFRVHFDSWTRQSVLEARLPELLPRLDTYEHEGALWARSSAYGDDEDRVLIRSDGGAPTYRAADVAYLVDKLERGFDRAIYVLGADHHGTRNWYAAVARMLGYDPARVEVLLYQLVHLTRGGEQTKMSKRRGDVVFLDAGISSTAVPTRRSRSTSTSRQNGRRRTRSTTCSTRTRASPASCATRRAQRSRRSRQARSPSRSASSSNDSPSCRRSRRTRPRSADRRRFPPTRSVSPTTFTASTTSTVCSRASKRRSGWASAGPRRR